MKDNYLRSLGSKNFANKNKSAARKIVSITNSQILAIAKSLIVLLPIPLPLKKESFELIIVPKKLNALEINHAINRITIMRIMPNATRFDVPGKKFIIVRLVKFKKLTIK